MRRRRRLILILLLSYDEEDVTGAEKSLEFTLKHLKNAIPSMETLDNSPFLLFVLSMMRVS
jgi:hypothetical protein